MHPVQVRSHKDTLANHIKGTPEQNLVLWWVVEDLPVLNDGPLELLDVDADEEHGRHEDDGLDTDLLSLVVLWLSSPVEEHADVLGHLRGCSRGAVLVLNETVEQDTGHSKGTTGEVRVVVQALSNLDTRWWVDVASEQREQVVSTTMTSLDDQAKIRGKSTGVSSSRRLLIRIRSREVVGQLSRALEHLTLVVRAVVVLDLLSHSARFVGGMRHGNEVAPGDTVEGVACGADLSVHLVTTSDARVVERVHEAVVGPGVGGGVQTVVRGGAGVNLAYEGERPIEVGVPGD